MHKTYAHALDDLLEHFSELAKSRTTLNQAEEIELIKELKSRIIKTYNCSSSEFLQMIRHLQIEYLVEDVGGFYRATFKGFDFLKRGGFTKEEQRKLAANISAVSTSSFLIAGAIATVVLAVLGIVQCNKESTNKKVNTESYQPTAKPDSILSRSKK